MSKTLHAGDSIKSISTLAGLVLTALMAGAQNVPPPPKPDTGPSLEVTMKYIEDKLNAVNFTYTTKMPDWDSAVLNHLRIKSVQTSPKDCALSWNETFSTSGIKDHEYDSEAQLSLRDARNVTVQKESDWLGQHPGLEGTEVLPDVYHLTINMQSGKTVHNHDFGNQKGDQETRSGEVSLPDKEYADRLAKAIVHAIELCGGGDNDPFR